jgi:hypothetical protein
LDFPTAAKKQEKLFLANCVALISARRFEQTIAARTPFAQYWADYGKLTKSSKLTKRTKGMGGIKAAHECNVCLLAMARFGALYTGVLGRAAEIVAFFFSRVVIGIAFIGVGILGGFMGFALDPGIGFGFGQLRFGVFDADVFLIALQGFALLFGHIVSRFSFFDRGIVLIVDLIHRPRARTQQQCGGYTTHKIFDEFLHDVFLAVVRYSRVMTGAICMPR